MNTTGQLADLIRYKGVMAQAIFIAWERQDYESVKYLNRRFDQLTEQIETLRSKP